MGNKTTCCDDYFLLDCGIGEGKCTDCPYLIQCTDNQKESIKEIFEEENDTDKKRGLDKGDLLG